MVIAPSAAEITYGEIAVKGHAADDDDVEDGVPLRCYIFHERYICVTLKKHHISGGGTNQNIPDRRRESRSDDTDKLTRSTLQGEWLTSLREREGESGALK